MDKMHSPESEYFEEDINIERLHALHRMKRSYIFLGYNDLIQSALPIMQRSFLRPVELGQLLPE